MNEIKEIRVYEATKNNGVTHVGLTFRSDKNITPSIYLEHLYASCQAGESMKTITHEMMIVPDGPMVNAEKLKK